MNALTCLALAAVCVSETIGYSLPTATELAAVKARFQPLQQLSFATEREYCGYLVRDELGALTFSEIVRGGHDGCTPVIPRIGYTPVASLHTHGAYNPTVPAEFPTTLDIDSDAREGVNGFIATPGGRLWFIDSNARVAVQMCGLGCLPQDPGFHPGDDGLIAKSYTYRELQSLELPH